MTATIFYPDVSNHNTGLTIQPGTVAVCAKATEGTTFTDKLYAGFRDQAARVGAVFFAYHWLHHGNVDAQAAHCFSVVGKTPVMIDCEDTGDVPTVADCVAFAKGLRARGGVCPLVYLPHWYWEGDLGSPDLRPLAAAGLGLVSSNYTTYSDSGPGWARYAPDQPEPVIWQYTDKLPYGGSAVDFNAFRGSVDDLRRLLTGGTSPTMEQTDPIKSVANQAGVRDGETVGDVIGDLGGLRDWLYDQPDGTFSKNPAPPGSRLAVLFEAATRPASPAPVAMTDADRQAIADLVGAKVDAVGAKLDLLLARLTAAGDALDG